MHTFKPTENLDLLQNHKQRSKSNLLALVAHILRVVVLQNVEYEHKNLEGRLCDDKDSTRLQLVLVREPFFGLDDQVDHVKQPTQVAEQHAEVNEDLAAGKTAGGRSA